MPRTLVAVLTVAPLVLAPLAPPPVALLLVVPLVVGVDAVARKILGR